MVLWLSLCGGFQLLSGLTQYIGWYCLCVCLLASADLCPAASGVKQDIFRLICACFIQMLLWLDCNKTTLDYHVWSFCLYFEPSKKTSCVFLCAGRSTEGGESLKIPYVMQRADSGNALSSAQHPALMCWQRCSNTVIDTTLPSPPLFILTYLSLVQPACHTL